VVAKVAEG